MARPTIFDEPMTAAERMRHYRARQRAPVREYTAYEQRLLLPNRLQAKLQRCSERHIYHHVAFNKYELIRWPDELLNGKYGKAGIEFLAEVCQYGDAATQRAVRDRIKKAGAAAGRALWQEFIHESDCHELLRKHRCRAERRALDRFGDYQMGLRRSPESSRLQKDAARSPDDL